MAGDGAGSPVPIPRLWFRRCVLLNAAAADRLHYFPEDGRRYLGASPSKKSVARLKPRISAILRRGNKDPWELVCEDVNRVLVGWARYFNYGTCTSAYCAIDHHVATRVRRFLVERHRVSSHGTRCFADATIFGELGVVRLRKLQGRRPSWASR